MRVNEDVYVGQDHGFFRESLCLQRIHEQPEFVEIDARPESEG